MNDCMFCRLDLILLLLFNRSWQMSSFIFHSFHCRCFAIQWLVWMVMVVLVLPVITQHSKLFQCIKLVCIEDVFSEGSVESFDVSILCWFAWLYVFNDYVITLAPTGEHLAQELGTIVNTNLFWKCSFFRYLFHHADHCFTRETVICMCSQRFTGTV